MSLDHIEAEFVVSEPGEDLFSVTGFCKYFFHSFLTYSQNPSTGLLPHIGASSWPMRVSSTFPTSSSLSVSLGKFKQDNLP